MKAAARQERGRRKAAKRGRTEQGGDAAGVCGQRTQRRGVAGREEVTNVFIDVEEGKPSAALLLTRLL
jgi:hypothetical protein